MSLFPEDSQNYSDTFKWLVHSFQGEAAVGSPIFLMFSFFLWPFGLGKQSPF